MNIDLVSENNNYVILNLPTPPIIITPTRSLRRKWNQLPRLQRVLIGMLAVVMVVLILSLITSPETTTATSFKLSPTAAEVNEENQMPLSQAALIKSTTPDPKINILPEKDNLLEDRPLDPIEKEILPAHPRDHNRIDINVPNKQTPRQEAVVNAMRHAWKGYKTFAWGHDHLLPISRSRNNWLKLGLTLVDSLDTLWLMDLKEEFSEARDWVEAQLKFDINKDVNLFETTIRVLGGLLSAYHLSDDKMFLSKSVDLADRLLGAFDSESGVPFSDVNLASGQPSKPKWGPDSSTSEVTTIQLEFRDLTMITGDKKYAEKVDFVSHHVHKLKKFDGLVPIFINAQTGQFRPHSTITLGARGDSYYEYLLKQWIQFGKKENELRDDYTEAVSGMEMHLAKKTYPSGLYFFGELHGASKSFINKMDELTCYLPGTLALGVHHGMPAHHIDVAQKLLYTCVQTWLEQPTKLAPELTYFNIAPNSVEDFYVKNNDAHYLLRPETIESLWYLYHFTGNTTYQDWGWQMFQGIETYCKTDNGYTSIGNVKSREATKPRDKMESFFLGETLKYLYFLFDDNQSNYNLDKYVLNSEAHLLPIYND